MIFEGHGFRPLTGTLLSKPVPSREYEGVEDLFPSPHGDSLI